MADATINDYALGEGPVFIGNHDDSMDESHPMLSCMWWKRVQIKRLDLMAYENEVVYLFMDQFEERNYALRDTCDKHCRDLAYSMRRRGFNYSHDIISLFYYTVRISSGCGV